MSTGFMVFVMKKQHRKESFVRLSLKDFLKKDMSFLRLRNSMRYLVEGQN